MTLATAPVLATLFASAQARVLSHADLAIICAYLVGVTLFGLHFRKGDNSLRGYFLAGGEIPWWAVSLSVVAAETSTLTIISVPGIAYGGNWRFEQLVLGYLLGRVIVCLLFLPRYFRGELLTAYQLIGQRFGPRLHTLTSLLFLFLRAAAEGVRVFAVSIVVGIALGLGSTISIAIICALTLVYTLEGGLTAVIWTDVVQVILYLAGSLVAFLLLGAHVPGGWPMIARSAHAAGKLSIFHFAFNVSDTYTFWAAVFGGCFLTMASHGTDQLMVQRLLSAGSLRASRLALLSSGVIILLQFTLFLAIGTGLFSFYYGAATVLPDHLFPRFIVEQMPRGAAGLLVASVLAAAMSNLSAAVNSLSSASMVDFLLRWRPALSAAARTYASRALTLFWALLLFVLALLSRGGGHVVEIGLAIASVAYGALLGVFLLGTLCQRATETGAILGMVSGLTLNLLLWLQPGPLKVSFLGYPTVLPKVAWTWFVLLGSLTTYAVGWAASIAARATYAKEVQ
jgi:SSS family transporter